MAQDLEKAQSRLANIRTVAPILAALRTISLGSWQMALNRRGDLQQYSARLLELLPPILPHLKKKWDWASMGSTCRCARSLASLGAFGLGHPWLAGDGLLSPTIRDAHAAGPQRVLVLVIGSERGLCGRYNASILERAVQHVEDLENVEVAVDLVALGKRIIRLLERRDCILQDAQSLPVTALPSFNMAFAFAQAWLRRYEAYELDAVDVVYSAYHNAGVYTPCVAQLFPPPLPALEAEFVEAVIVETDPLRLYTRVVEQWSALRLYSLFLEAAASEHSARFRLMESATQNTDRLIEELTQVIQSERRHAITREMQELAVGAGLLGYEEV